MENIRKTVSLSNGLELQIVDASKKIASDRWRIAVVIRMEIPLETLSDNPDLDEIRRELGESVVFEKKIERNFVDAKEKEALIETLSDSYLSSTQSYLSSHAFPERFVRRQYKSALAMRAQKNARLRNG